MERKTHTIDAVDKALGRLSTQIAILLRGKQKSDFVPYEDMGDFVVVKNVDKIKITGKKREKKIYYRHTAYLGGLKKTPLKKMLERDPARVLKMAVLGMLPRNRLRARQIKRLRIE